MKIRLFLLVLEPFVNLQRLKILNKLNSKFRILLMLAMQYHSVRVKSAQAFKDLVAFLLSPILMAIHASILKFLHYCTQFLVHLQHPQPSVLQHLPQAPLLLPLLLQSSPAKNTGSVNSMQTSCLILCPLKLILSKCRTAVRYIHFFPHRDLNKLQKTKQ